MMRVRDFFIFASLAVVAAFFLGRHSTTNRELPKPGRASLKPQEIVARSTTDDTGGKDKKVERVRRLVEGLADVPTFSLPPSKGLAVSESDNELDVLNIQGEKREQMIKLDAVLNERVDGARKAARTDGGRLDRALFNRAMKAAVEDHEKGVAETIGEEAARTFKELRLKRTEKFLEDVAERRNRRQDQ